ncbi:MAG: TetR/AcrR family transcriptional regulator [Marinicaulis sp.]|nr:TetR/AcrR family transcriptional regulator [Marinicaulis sp.]NNE39903.1 TetR/AcrR family transcriptional regulator [Marinicaulis sp.]NNL89961.1 TetR/AcrR family transcriptional regulator [Marinicaulis sp.]
MAQESRRERKKRATRNKILNTALSLFAENGYEKVRVEDIREKVDIANATFFAYFPTKVSLIKAFGEDLIGAITDRLDEYEGGAIDRLEILRVIYFDEWAAHIELLRVLLADPGSPEALAISAVAEDLLDIIEELTQAGQQEGAISKGYDARLVAHCIMGGWRAAMINFLRSGDHTAATSANRQILDIVLGGAATD